VPHSIVTPQSSPPPDFSGPASADILPTPVSFSSKPALRRLAHDPRRMCLNQI
jgi:hypothetical protein